LPGITGATGTPASLPATRRLDNFITLLHERISRELSITFDDAARQNRDLFLAQFDISAYPYKDAKDHVLQVRFSAEGESAELLAYDLYPAMSAYNITQFYGKSNGTGISAGAAFLFGFGASVEYRRQRDYARSSITQSVYTSGFGAGTNSFGWYFGPAPDEHLLSPGSKTVYAVISVPKQTGKPRNAMKLTADVRWVEKQAKYQGTGQQPNLTPLAIKLNLPAPSLQIEQISYQTKYASLSSQELANESATDEKAKTDTAAVQIDFLDTIDPNLVVTVNGVIIPRLRDARGRATVAKSATRDPATGAPSEATFGLLETDSKGESYWMALGPRRMSVQVTRALAGREKFPIIRLLQGGQNNDTSLMLMAMNGVKAISVNGKVFNSCPVERPRTEVPGYVIAESLQRLFPPTGFAPLFSSAATVPIHVWRKGNDLQIQREADSNVAPADEQTQVYVEATGGPYALFCHQDGDLVCALPPHIQSLMIDGVWAERGVKSKLSGFAGHADRDEIEVADSTPIRFDADQTPDITQTRNPDGSLSGWIVKFNAHGLTAQDTVAGWNSSATATLQPVTLPTELGIGENPQYETIRPPLSSRPTGIRLWIPVAHVGDLLRSRLYVMRAMTLGKQPKTFRIAGELPNIFNMILPVVSGDGMPDDSNDLIVRGEHLDNISAIRIAGCGSGTAAPLCSVLTSRINGSVLVLYADAKLAAGTYPLQFRLGPTLWLNTVLLPDGSRKQRTVAGSILFHKPPTKEKEKAEPTRKITDSKPKVTPAPPPPDPVAAVDEPKGMEKKAPQTDRPWLQFFPESSNQMDMLISPVSPAERRREANAKP
jgi:hypothetical protein